MNSIARTLFLRSRASTRSTLLPSFSAFSTDAQAVAASAASVGPAPESRGAQRTRGRRRGVRRYRRGAPNPWAYQRSRGKPRGPFPWHDQLRREAAIEADDPKKWPEGWDVHSRRCGVVAMKCGMLSLWEQPDDPDTMPTAHPCTVLQIDRCQVVSQRVAEQHGYTALQVGGGSRKAKQVGAALLGQFKKAGVPPKMKLAEFRVTPNALLPVGTEITCRHFVPGQFVDVQGTSSGKGTQGVMKRWGFKGQPATHGVSKYHRGAGAIGGCQDPGRVFKGKKMAGKMGNRKTSVHSLRVLKIDPKRNLLFLRGTVPGHKGSFLRIRDSIRKPFMEDPPPFPGERRRGKKQS